MGFFLETLFGGLMAGMLYSLIALGFVLIYKASGVFNFAQGAMVLFAALAMARFSEWFPLWFHFDSKLLANLLAFAPCGLTVSTSCMFMASGRISTSFAWIGCCRKCSVFVRRARFASSALQRASAWTGIASSCSRLSRMASGMC